MENKNSDFEYINSVSQALVEKTPKSTKVILYVIFFLVCAFFIWAYFAKVEQLVRGEAKVIPSGQNQIVQNFEGGIVSKILVEEGDLVKKGDSLLKLTNKQYSASYEKNILELNMLRAQEIRLNAEANNEKLNLLDLSKDEYELYKSDLNQLNSKLSVLEEQKFQKEKEKMKLNQRLDI